MPTLARIAQLIRSKNAGPFLLTFDIMCENEAAYRRIRDSGCLTREIVAELYRVDSEKVLFFEYPPAYSFKATIPRRVACGDPEDPDIYGAQQHVLIAQIQLP